MTLSSLISRVEEGEGSDRILERDIWIVMGWSYEKRGKDRKPWLYAPAGYRYEGYRRDPDDVVGWSLSEMTLTTSLDAVVSLIEQKLPGLSWEVRRSGFGSPCQAMIWDPMKAPPVSTLARLDAKSPARALLAACLRALSALEDSKAGLADAHKKDRP